MTGTVAAEAQVLLLCASVDRSPGTDKALAHVVHTEPLDWPRLLSMGRRHGVLALAHAQLDAFPPDAVPAHVSAYLARHAQATRQRNHLLTAELRELVGALARVGVDGRPLKASALPSDTCELVELDLLVRREDVPAAAAVLGARGYAPETVDVSTSLLSDHGCRFVDARGIAVSVQWAAAARSLGQPFDLGPFWRASPDGQPLLELLCVRGTLNRWQRLAWVREVAVLLAGRRSIDVAAIARRARRHGYERAIAIGCRLARDLLGAPVDLDARTLRSAAPLAEQLRRRLVDPGQHRAGFREVWSYHLGTRRRWRDKARYCVARIATPSAADLAGLRPTPRSPWGRYLVRTVYLGRQVARYARGPRRRPRGPQELARFGRTPLHVIARMIRLAALTERDVLYDIGCGDGRVLLTVAARIGLRAVGLDLNPELVAAARANAERADLASRVTFHHQDAFDANLSEATAVFLYLNARANLALRPMLRERLRPGTRLVSFNFDMDDWLPDDTEVIDEAHWGTNTLYLWRV
jgi:protein-L-isoaspartate O-methyltransferase